MCGYLSIQIKGKGACEGNTHVVPPVEVIERHACNANSSMITYFLLSIELSECAPPVYMTPPRAEALILPFRERGAVKHECTCVSMQDWEAKYCVMATDDAMSSSGLVAPCECAAPRQEFRSYMILVEPSIIF